MTDSAAPQLISAAAAQVAKALDGLSAPPLDVPTPCTEFTLRTLVNHFAGTSQAMAVLGHGESLDPDDPWGSRTDVAADHWTAELANRVRAAGAAWADEQPWNHPHDLGGSQMPGRALGEMAFVELLVHGWDIVTAAGGRLKVSDDVGRELERCVAETAELGRQMGAYAHAVPVDADAPAFERALGLSGRNPTWSPA